MQLICNFVFYEFVEPLLSDNGAKIVEIF